MTSLVKCGSFATVVVLCVGVLAGCGSSDDSGPASSQGTPSTTRAPASAPAPAPPPAPAPKKTAREKLEAALPDDAEVTGAADDVVVFVETPKGGFDGASVDDLDRTAAEIFRAIYGAAGYSRPSRVVFRGGLMDTRTGKALPDDVTGRYSMSKKEAGDIDWSDKDIEFKINWGLFRTFAHPALKQD